MIHFWSMTDAIWSVTDVTNHTLRVLHDMTSVPPECLKKLIKPHKFDPRSPLQPHKIIDKTNPVITNLALIGWVEGGQFMKFVFLPYFL